MYVASSQRRGPSPASPFHRVASPAGAAPLGPHSSSSLHGSRRSDRPRSPSHDRSRSRDAFSGHPRPSRRSHERFEERDVPSDTPAHSRRPRDRESPSRRHLDFPSKSPRSGSLRRGRILRQGNVSLLEGHPLLSEGASLLTLHSRSDSPLGGPLRLLKSDSLHGGPLRLLKSDSPHGGRLLTLKSDSPHGGHLRLPRGASPQRGHPHPSEWDSLQKQGLAPPGDPFLGSHVLQDRTPPGIPPLQREVPLPLNDDAMSRVTLSLLITITHLELRLESLLKGDPIQDHLLTTLPRLHGRRRKLMRPQCHRRLRLWLTSS